MTQLIDTANTCNIYFHLTLRKSVTNGQRTADRQQTDSTVYRVAAQLINQDHFERSGPRPEWKLRPRLSLRFETYNSKVTLVCEHDKSVFRISEGFDK